MNLSNSFKIAIFLACLLFCSCNETIKPSNSLNSVESANTLIWERFVGDDGIIHDYTDLKGNVSLPTPQECKDGKPNALGWWSPIENGAMFNGLYLDGAILRWQHTGKLEDAEKVKKLVNGLLILSSASDVEGFIARGVSTDKKSHYPMGSNDQTGGWFYGLWRYLETDLPSNEERIQIKNIMIKTAKAIVKLKWKMPAESPFDTRGSFYYLDYNCIRLLFVAKIIYLITKDEYWNQLYKDSFYKPVGANKIVRKEVIEAGLKYESSTYSIWVESLSLTCLRSLWEIEKDTTIKESYRKGLDLSASVAMKSIQNGFSYPNDDNNIIDTDWRKLSNLWISQITENQAEDLAQLQLKDLSKRSAKWHIETKFVREPIFAAWIVSLNPDKAVLKQRSPDLLKLIQHYSYKKVYHVWFFPVESTWWRLSAL